MENNQIKVMSCGMDSDDLHLIGEVDNEWTASDIIKWVSPKIDECFMFDIVIGTFESKPVWIVLEV